MQKKLAQDLNCLLISVQLLKLLQPVMIINFYDKVTQVFNAGQEISDTMTSVSIFENGNLLVNDFYIPSSLGRTRQRIL